MTTLYKTERTGLLNISSIELKQRISSDVYIENTQEVSLEQAQVKATTT